MSVWNFLDPLYYKITRLQYIEQNGKKTIMRVRLTRYKGKRITLSDGTVINKNDMLLKVHLHNVQLIRKIHGYSDIRKALIVYKNIKESLPSIASYIHSHRYAKEIKGLIGITAIYKGSNKLGFESVTIDSTSYKIFKRIAHLPIHFLASSKLFTKENREPMYLFMSKERLLNEYVEI